MECPNIGEVKFSKASIDAINEIRKIKLLSEALVKVIGSGHLANIFLGNDALKSSYAVYSTDFITMSNALTAVPKIQKRRIADVANMAYLTVTSFKEKQFWMAISSGCKIPQ